LDPTDVAEREILQPMRIGAARQDVLEEELYIFA
jgi:hypothetical protein